MRIKSCEEYKILEWNNENLKIDLSLSHTIFFVLFNVMTYLMRSGRRSNTLGLACFRELLGDNATVHARISSVDSSTGYNGLFSSGFCKKMKCKMKWKLLLLRMFEGTGVPVRGWYVCQYREWYKNMEVKLWWCGMVEFDRARKGILRTFF